MSSKLVTQANFEYILEVSFKFLLTKHTPLIKVVGKAKP